MTHLKFIFDTHSMLLVQKNWINKISCWEFITNKRAASPRTERECITLVLVIDVWYMYVFSAAMSQVHTVNHIQSDANIRSTEPMQNIRSFLMDRKRQTINMEKL